jgi:hypothetical protein
MSDEQSSPGRCSLCGDEEPVVEMIVRAAGKERRIAVCASCHLDLRRIEPDDDEPSTVT